METKIDTLVEIFYRMPISHLRSIVIACKVQPDKPYSRTRKKDLTQALIQYSFINEYTVTSVLEELRKLAVSLNFKLPDSLQHNRKILLGSITQCLMPDNLTETSMDILMFQNCSEMLPDSSSQVVVCFSPAFQKLEQDAVHEIMFPARSYVFTEGRKEIITDLNAAYILSTEFVKCLKTSGVCAIGWENDRLDRNIYKFGVTVSLFVFIYEIQSSQFEILCNHESDSDIEIPSTPNADLVDEYSSTPSLHLVNELTELNAIDDTQDLPLSLGSKNTLLSEEELRKLPSCFKVVDLNSASLTPAREVGSHMLISTKPSVLPSKSPINETVEVQKQLNTTQAVKSQTSGSSSAQSACAGEDGSHMLISTKPSVLPSKSPINETVEVQKQLNTTQAVKSHTSDERPPVIVKPVKSSIQKTGQKKHQSETMLATGSSTYSPSPFKKRKIETDRLSIGGMKLLPVAEENVVFISPHIKIVGYLPIFDEEKKYSEYEIYRKVRHWNKGPLLLEFKLEEQMKSYLQDNASNKLVLVISQEKKQFIPSWMYVEVMKEEFINAPQNIYGDSNGLLEGVPDLTHFLDEDKKWQKLYITRKFRPEPSQMELEFKFAIAMVVLQEDTTLGAPFLGQRYPSKMGKQFKWHGLPHKPVFKYTVDEWKKVRKLEFYHENAKKGRRLTNIANLAHDYYNRVNYGMDDCSLAQVRAYVKITSKADMEERAKFVDIAKENGFTNMEELRREVDRLIFEASEKVRQMNGAMNNVREDERTLAPTEYATIYPQESQSEVGETATVL